MRADGYGILASPEGTIEYDTLQCCHCQAHYRVRPGSGKRRGWCARCAAATCGLPRCIPCRPFEKQLAAFEAREATLRSILG